MDDDSMVLAYLLRSALARLEGLEELVAFVIARLEDHEGYLIQLQERILELEAPRAESEHRRFR